VTRFWSIQLGCGFALALALATPLSWAQTEPTDGPPPGVAIPLDGVRPASLPGRLVAFDAPVAVHAGSGVDAEKLFAVRDAAVSALNALEVRFGFPQPAPDGTRGGGPELDLYVVPDGPASTTEIDALEYGALWDRASAFVRVRRDLEGDALRRAVAEGVAQAILLGIDAHAARPWRIALATALAERATALGPDLDAYRLAQRNPGDALIRDRDDDSARGASMFPEFLADRFDSPGLRLLRGLAWMPVAATPDDRSRLQSFPSVFDAMDRLFRDEPGGVEGVLTEFAVTRALLGSSADASNLSGGTLDPSLGPDVLRTIDYGALPAWISPAPPLDETGVAYVLIDTLSARDGTINLWFHGAPWRQWKVTVLRLDSSYRVGGRVSDAPVVHGEWSTVIENLDRVARLVVVINDFGNGNFDPAEGPSRQGWFVLHASR
jgi:hypothetical protein